MKTYLLKRNTSVLILMLTALMMCFTAAPVSAVSKPGKVKSLSISASSGEKETHTVRLSWSKVKKAKGYQVVRNDKEVKKVKSTSASVTVKKEGDYKFKVRAYKTYSKKQWYNKKTNKWQKKRPAKKYRGKSKKVTMYKYGAWSPSKSARYSASDFTEGGEDEWEGTIDIPDEIYDVDGNKDLICSFNEDWQNTNVASPDIWYARSWNPAITDGILKEGRDYDVIQKGTMDNDWITVCKAKGNFSGTFRYIDYEANYKYHENIIVNACKGKSDVEKIDYVRNYCKGYQYAGVSGDPNVAALLPSNAYFYNRGHECLKASLFCCRLYKTLGIKSLQRWGKRHMANQIIFEHDGEYYSYLNDFSGFKGGYPEAETRVEERTKLTSDEFIIMDTIVDTSYLKNTQDADPAEYKLKGLGMNEIRLALLSYANGGPLK